MSNDKVISLENPEGNADVLTDLLRSGARELIKKAVQVELSEFLSQYQDMTDSEGKPLVVRNGYLVVPEKPYFQRKMVKKVRVFIQQSVENGF